MALTRHPNYFGEAVVGWGLFVIAMARWENVFVIFAPIVMTVLLTRVSGVPLRGASLKKRRAGYAEYVARTSSFIPMPPKKSVPGAAEAS